MSHLQLQSCVELRECESEEVKEGEGKECDPVTMDALKHFKYVNIPVFNTASLMESCVIYIYTFLTLGAHAQQGLQYLVCVCMCVCVCVSLSTTILALQAARRLMSDTNSFSTTSTRKIKWRFC